MHFSQDINEVHLLCMRIRCVSDYCNTITGNNNEILNYSHVFQHILQTPFAHIEIKVKIFKQNNCVYLKTLNVFITCSLNITLFMFEILPIRRKTLSNQPIEFLY